MATNRWSREQLIVAFGLYCQLPFGRMHKSNPDIVKTARLIGRTPSSLAMKLVNFASLDPAITSTGRKGLGNASSDDRKVWDEFHADWESLALQSANIFGALDVKFAKTKKSEEDVSDIENFAADGKKAWVEVRTKQDFFRRAVINSYKSRCCMSGLEVPMLLIASHIVPWKIDPSNRLNPRNGLCLSALHDRAFDKGLVTVTTDLRIKVSKLLKKIQSDKFLTSSLIRLDGNNLLLPEKFFPDPGFLAFHVKNIFKG
ncbi:MAG: HNH endonuclease [Candidatus Binataceae bacterium]